MPEISERTLAILATLLAGLILGLLLIWQPELPESPLPRALPAGGEFTLQSADGQVSLKDYRGKVVLVHFGYTYCPDICPISLAATAEALAGLTPTEQTRVAGFFVSLDPERDTPARLKEYVRFFHPALVGLTGTNDKLAEIARRYDIFYSRQAPMGAGDGYVIDHSADICLVGPDGQLLAKIPHATPPENIRAEIRRYLSPRP